MRIKTKAVAATCAVVGVICIAVALILSSNKTFDVSFDTDGGSHVSMQTVKKGAKVTKPSNPTKDEYSFLRWEYNGKEYDFTGAVESDMTLKAIWEKNEPLPTYKITFNVEGTTKTIEVSSASEIIESNLGFEEKSGYGIKWYLDGNEYDLSTPISSDITITGKYEKVTSYTVKFNSNGGSAVSNQTVKKGEKAVEPTNVVYEGYILDGWYLNNNKYDFNTEVVGNITLKAKWSEDPSIKRYEVKFNSDGGSSVASQKVIENKTVTQPKNPTKTNYEFDGWYLNNSKYNFSTKVTSDITLVAHWKEAIKYTVTFDSVGGSEVSPQTVSAGGKATKPADPTKSGVIFKEWRLNGAAYDFNSAVNGNITLVALYREAAQYTVTFNSNGGSAVNSQTITEGGKVTKPTNPTKMAHTFSKWTLNGSEYDFNRTVTGSITLVAEWTQNRKYTVKAEKVDNFSTDLRLTVYDGSSTITQESIHFTDGTKICSGTPCVVTASNMRNVNQVLVKVNGIYYYANVQ